MDSIWTYGGSQRQTTPQTWQRPQLLQQPLLTVLMAQLPLHHLTTNSSLIVRRSKALCSLISPTGEMCSLLIQNYFAWLLAYIKRVKKQRYNVAVLATRWQHCIECHISLHTDPTAVLTGTIYSTHHHFAHLLWIDFNPWGWFRQITFSLFWFLKF